MSAPPDRRTVPCCSYGWDASRGERGPIYWNPERNCVCCHNCGAVFVVKAASDG